MTDSARIEVGIAIPTAGAGIGLERLLHSLAARAQAREVVVVDNGSSRRDLEALCRAQGARVVLCTEPGLARARAAGVRACKSDVVMFLDDDTAFQDGSLVELGSFFARHPRVGACGVSVINHLPLEVRQRYGWILHLMAESGHGKAWRIASRRPDMVVPGAALAVRRTAWAATGCDRTLLAGDYAVHPIRGEDLEVQYRMVRAGWTVWCNPRIEVGHHPDTSRFTRQRMERVCYWSCAGGAVARRAAGMPGSLEGTMEALRSWLGAWLALRREPDSEIARLRRAMAEGSLLGLLRPEATRLATQAPRWIECEATPSEKGPQ